MPPDPATGQALLQRSMSVVVAIAVAIAVLGSASCAGAADVAPATPGDGVTAAAGSAVTTTSARTTTSTIGAGRQAGTESNEMLPLLFAAIVFLVLLVPASGFHSHGHWHRH